MPYMVYSDEAISSRADFRETDIEYDYPLDADGEVMDLDPKSKLHRKLLSRILKYAQESAGVMSERFDSWNEIDRTQTAYIETDDAEKEIVYNDPRKPVSIVFPYTYAIKESILSYLVAAFFQEPIFQYEGVGPEDVIGSIMLEKVIDLHCNKSKVALDLHTVFSDSLGYGVGYCAPTWKKEVGFKTVMREEDRGFFRSSEKVKSYEESVLFEGNALENIDPYLALPDPNVSVHKIQDGEFFGWVERTNSMNLLSDEKNKNGEYFNVKYVSGVRSKNTSIYGTEKSDREKRAKGGGRQNRYHTAPSSGSGVRGAGSATSPVDVIHMYVKIIPREWELGKGEYPEKWLFSVAADSVIVRAKPLHLDHNKFPIAVAAPDFDGYSPTPISRLEMLFGLQKVLDWMFNMHVANVRKTVNDVLIYDPYLINSKDINSPEAGKRIRIRRPGWGRGVKDSVMQLPVNDVTKQHVADSSWIVQWMQKIGGADDSAMGSLRQGGPERLSAEEFSGTQAGQFSRLGRLARVIGLQCMQDVGTMFAADTQQLMTQEQYVKVTGRWQQVLLKEFGINELAKNRGRIKVDPFQLLVNYDIKAKDGSMPGGNFSGIWMRMFDTIANNPELGQKFDIGRIFSHIARNNGAKNVDEFMRVKVLSDEAVQNEEQQGNLVPFQGAM